MTKGVAVLAQVDPGIYRGKRLLSTFLLLFAVIFGAGDLVSYLTRPGYQVPWYGYLFLLSAAVLNRTGHYLTAAGLTLAMFPLVTLVSVLGGANPETTFTSLTIGLILASILLNRGGAMFFSAFCFLFLLAMPLLIPHRVPSLRSILTPLVLVAITSGLSTILIVHRDELERDRQEALRTSEERLRLALDAARMGTWEWDPASGEVRSSENAEAIFGMPPHTFDGTPAGYLRVVHKDDREAVAKELAHVFSGQRENFEILHRVTWPDGSIRSIQIEGRSTRHDGHVRVNGTVKDITDRKLAEAERDRLIQELENKNAELERFTYTVSHDLKSPLITVRGFLGSIDQDIKDGRHDRLGVDIERVFSATSRMHKLLDELLSLSRIGRIVNPPERVAMADLVKEASAMVRGRLDAAKVRVEIEDDLPDVYGDRSRLVQVFQNLLDNAAKFLGDQKAPRILVGSRKSASDGRPVFFVQDNGVGVDAANLERMLGLFQKLDERSGGTGVGLAIVKRVVEVHGGKLWVESAGRGLGTTVCFTLPTRASV